MLVPLARDFAVKPRSYRHTIEREFFERMDRLSSLLVGLEERQMKRKVSREIYGEPQSPRDQNGSAVRFLQRS